MPLGYAPRIGDVLDYYKRDDIAMAIYRYGKDRKIKVTNDTSSLAGRGGQITIQSPDDVVNLAKKFLDGNENAAPRKYPSFHGTIEVFSKEFIKQNHRGADIVIDIDIKDNFREAFKQGRKVLDLLDYYNVPHRIKFSGGSGPHIIIPYEWLPKSLQNDDFSKTHHIIFHTIVSLSKASHIDSSFISFDHYHRIPYSINEHTGLISLPLHRDQYNDFTPSMAEIWNVQVDETWFSDINDYAKESILELLSVKQKLKG